MDTQVCSHVFLATTKFSVTCEMAKSPSTCDHRTRVTGLTQVSPLIQGSKESGDQYAQNQVPVRRLSSVWNTLPPLFSGVGIWGNFCNSPKPTIWQAHPLNTTSGQVCLHSYFLRLLYVKWLQQHSKKLPESVHHYPHLNDYRVSSLSVTAGFFPWSLAVAGQNSYKKVLSSDTSYKLMCFENNPTFMSLCLWSQNQSYSL